MSMVLTRCDPQLSNLNNIARMPTSYAELFKSVLDTRTNNSNSTENYSESVTVMTEAALDVDESHNDSYTGNVNGQMDASSTTSLCSDIGQSVDQITEMLPAQLVIIDSFKESELSGHSEKTCSSSNCRLSTTQMADDAISETINVTKNEAFDVTAWPTLGQNKSNKSQNADRSYETQAPTKKAQKKKWVPLPVDIEYARQGGPEKRKYPNENRKYNPNYVHQQTENGKHNPRGYRTNSGTPKKNQSTPNNRQQYHMSKDQFVYNSSEKASSAVDKLVSVDDEGNKGSEDQTPVGQHRSGNKQKDSVYRPNKQNRDAATQMTGFGPATLMYGQTLPHLPYPPPFYPIPFNSVMGAPYNPYAVPAHYATAYANGMNVYPPNMMADPNVAYTSSASSDEQQSNFSLELSSGWSSPTNVAFPQQYSRPPPRQTSFPDEASLKSYILWQIEYYFSMENLCRDAFMRQNMDSQGFVPLSLIAEFKRVKSTGANLEIIKQALSQSNYLEMNEKSDGVRLAHDWNRWIIDDEEQDLIDEKDNNAGTLYSDENTQLNQEYYGVNQENQV